MNKSYLLFHLKEALKELQSTVRELDNDPEYAEAEFYIAMQHLYHHLNTAWNSRDLEEAKEETEEQFSEWRQFPKDIDLST